MKLLNIFSLYPDALLPVCLEKTKIGLDFARHNLQEAMLKGYKENGTDYHVVNSPSMGSFPPYSNMVIVPPYQSKDGRIDSVSYLNVSLLKRVSQVRSVRKKVMAWCRENEGKDAVVLFYNFNLLAIANDIKKRYPNVKTALMVTDLEEYTTPAETVLTRLNSAITSILPHTDFAASIDGYILLSEDMKERLPVADKPYLHMEGIYNSEKSVEVVAKDPHKVVLYTGNLGKRYGILDLLKAFELIQDEDYRLWVRGDGECIDIVKEAAVRDGRITLFERMPREELLELEKKATVVVNPVHSSEEFTRFFFPSKTMEYMASGTPTLMARLACMPREYDEHLYYFDDETPEGMSLRLQQICSKPSSELHAFGKAASEFIHREKTPQRQTARMIGFFKSL